MWKSHNFEKYTARLIEQFKNNLPFGSSDSLYGFSSVEEKLLLSEGLWFSFNEPSEEPTDPTVSDRWRSR